MDVKPMFWVTVLFLSVLIGLVLVLQKYSRNQTQTAWIQKGDIIWRGKSRDGLVNLMLVADENIETSTLTKVSCNLYAASIDSPHDILGAQIVCVDHNILDSKNLSFRLKLPDGKISDRATIPPYVEYKGGIALVGTLKSPFSSAVQIG